MDLFNLNTINKRIMALNKSLIDISPMCEEYLKNPNEQNGENIVGAVIEVQGDIDKLKETVAYMVNMLASEDDIVHIDKKNNGFEITGE